MTTTATATLTIRRAGPADEALIAQLGADLAAASGMDIPATSQFLADAANIVLLAFIDAHAAGMALLHRTADGCAEVVFIGVAADRRGQGIATTLFNSGLFALLPVRALHAVVPAGAAQAMRWLEHRGFQPEAAPQDGAAEGLRYELRLDRPAQGCGCGDGGCGCGSGC